MIRAVTGPWGINAAKPTMLHPRLGMYG
ncbi:MAG: hypothetical protein JWO76_1381, partial [Nocardioides sp.]|nr:hypothetical protein [Nocardioides sp.]